MKVLPETLRLSPDAESIDFDEISSLVKLYFCEKHWEECKNRVLIEEENVLHDLHIQAEQPYPTVSYKGCDSIHSRSIGEIESERQELIRKSFQDNPRETNYRRELYGKGKGLDDIFEQGDVQRKFIQWTIEELPSEELGKTEPLKDVLVDELHTLGFNAERIYQLEADVEATLSGITFYFQVTWLNQDSKKVTEAEMIANPFSSNSESGLWDHTIPSDLYFNPNRGMWTTSSLRRFADEHEGIPVSVVRWDDEDEWYILFYRPSEFGGYLVTDDLSWIPIRIYGEYTPLPVLENLTEILSSEATLDKLSRISSQSCILSSLYSIG